MSDTQYEVTRLGICIASTYVFVPRKADRTLHCEPLYFVLILCIWHDPSDAGGEIVLEEELNKQGPAVYIARLQVVGSTYKRDGHVLGEILGMMGG